MSNPAGANSLSWRRSVPAGNALPDRSEKRVSPRAENPVLPNPSKVPTLPPTFWPPSVFLCPFCDPTSSGVFSASMDEAFQISNQPVETMLAVALDFESERTDGSLFSSSTTFSQRSGGSFPWPSSSNMKNSSGTHSAFASPASAVSHLHDVHRITILDVKGVVPVFSSYVGTYAQRAADVKTQAGLGRSPIAMVEGVRARVEHGEELHIIGGTIKDASLRKELREKKLNETLRIQERERQDDEEDDPAAEDIVSTPLDHVSSSISGSVRGRKCLFCKHIFSGRRSRGLLFAHMFDTHSFSIGLLDNLVYVDEYLALLNSKLQSLQCLYCEKTFKDQTVLRKHMRKKKHFKINPRNPEYDRFYIINYVQPPAADQRFDNHDSLLRLSREFGQRPQSQGSEADEDEDDMRWDDWTDDEGDCDPTMCLFDETVHPTPIGAHEHMKLVHGFDLIQIRKNLGMNVYQTIQLINYIRRQTSFHSCFQCRKTFDTLDEMVAHLHEENHLLVKDFTPAQMPWNDAQYLLPTYENDPLITLDLGSDSEPETEDDHESKAVSSGVQVIAEEDALARAAAQRQSRNEQEIEALVTEFQDSTIQQEEELLKQIEREYEERLVDEWRHDRDDAEDQDHSDEDGGDES